MKRTKLVVGLDLLNSDKTEKVNMIVPVTAFDIVIIAACCYTVSSCCRSVLIRLHRIPEPTPPITYDRTALIVGNCLTPEVMVATGIERDSERW